VKVRPSGHIGTSIKICYFASPATNDVKPWLLSRFCQVAGLKCRKGLSSNSEPQAEPFGCCGIGKEANVTSRWLLRKLTKDVSMSSKTDFEMGVHIRWMIRKDMPEVLEIENSSFEFPWSEDDFIRCLRQRNCIGMVAEHGERVVGFMIYELHKTRLHVLNFAVAPTAHARSAVDGSARTFARASRPRRQPRGHG